MNNVTVGESGDHEGFTAASDKLIAMIDDYVSRNVAGDAKLWLTGYCRGAGVANLVAAHYDDQTNSIFGHDNSFVYLVAASKGTVDENADSDAYDNIHNAALDSDIFANVAPSG